MGGTWAGAQMQCCAEFRLTLLWQMHRELHALFPAETTAGTDGDFLNLATAVASRHRSSVVDPYMLTTRTTCTCGACGDVLSKYENALVYDVSLPAVKPGKANEWVSLDECRRFSSSAHAIPEWACRACGRAHPDSSNAMALCDDPTALPIVLTVRLGRFLDVSEEMPARARFRRLPARAHFRLPRVLRFSQRSWTNKNALEYV